MSEQPPTEHKETLKQTKIVPALRDQAWWALGGTENAIFLFYFL